MTINAISGMNLNQPIQASGSYFKSTTMLNDMKAAEHIIKVANTLRERGQENDYSWTATCRSNGAELKILPLENGTFNVINPSNPKEYLNLNAEQLLQAFSQVDRVKSTLTIG